MSGRSVGPLIRRRDGTAAVELALIAPMLLLLLSSLIDFSRVYRQEIALSTAVSAAAQYALLNAASVNSTNAAALAATLGGIVTDSNGTSWASVAVTVNGGATRTVSSGGTVIGGTAANSDKCWCPAGSSAAWTWGTAATCGITCAGGTVAGKFVTIAGTRNFDAIFGQYGFITNRTLRQSTIVQTQ